MPQHLLRKISSFFIITMRIASNEIRKLRSMAENSLNKTAELQKVLAQIEATLTREETKFIQKNKLN